MNNTVLICGLGNIGGLTLEFLARLAPDLTFLGVNRNKDKGIRKINEVQLGITHHGFFPGMIYESLDISDVDKTAKLLSKYMPSVICNFTTIYADWTKVNSGRLSQAKMGPWLPMHLAPAYDLMTAVKKSGINTYVINGAYPDVVNPVLHKMGLTPLVGVGNIDNRIPAIRLTIAKKFGSRPQEIEIYFYGHRSVSTNLDKLGHTNGVPYYLKIFIGGKDVTDEIDINWLFSKIPTMWKRCTGSSGSPLVASSAVKNVLAILKNKDILTHGPGPNGLPGGYTVRINKKGVQLVFPHGLTISEAIKINEKGAKFDGIEKIENDGTVIFTSESYEIMKQELGYDCPVLYPDEIKDRAYQLLKKYEEYTLSENSLF